MATVIDLFAGAGLFSAAFMRSGFTVQQAVELDRNAAASYRRNVGPWMVQGSVLDTFPEGAADVVIAGPPCQGFSTLGRRDPSDARNILSLDIPRWAAMASAKIVVVENVPPFLKSKHWQTLALALSAQGFSIETWELEAFDYGAPQLRRRAFTVASRVGPIGQPAKTAPGPSVGTVLSSLKNKPRGVDPMHIWPEPKGIAAERIAVVPLRGDKRDLLRIAPELCPPSWKKMGCQATDVWGRLDEDLPSNTLRCTFQNPSKGRYLHPTENRTLSLREGARIQGIPDDWFLEGKPYPIARQIGNGVPIPLGEAVAARIRSALS